MITCLQKKEINGKKDTKSFCKIIQHRIHNYIYNNVDMIPINDMIHIYNLFIELFSLLPFLQYNIMHDFLSKIPKALDWLFQTWEKFYCWKPYYGDKFLYLYEDISIKYRNLTWLYQYNLKIKPNNILNALENNKFSDVVSSDQIHNLHLDD